MSTRCLIGKENKDTTVTYIYCHNDGYIKYVGEKLYNNYTDEKIVDQLLALGDMSTLGDIPKPAHDFEDYDDYYCRPYSLRGEHTPAQKVNSVKEFRDLILDQNYTYLFKDGEWLVKRVTEKEFSPLKFYIY